LRASGLDVVIDEINTVPFFTPKFVDKDIRIIALIHQLAREYWFYETPFPLGHIGYHYLEEKWLKNYFEVPTITVSESSRRDLLDLGFRKVSVVPEGLNFEPLTAVPELHKTPVLAYAGRLVRAKRPDHAIKAFKIVKQQVPEAEMWLFGDGPFRGTLEKMTIEGVRYFGNLPDDERRRLLSKAWVVVNPSVREGWGLNIIEANALGVPSVAYNVPGLRDSVRHESTGLLAEAGNIEDLAEKIIQVFRSKALIQTLRSGSLEYSKSFSWDKTANEFMNVMEGLQKH
jgi:glycosyltransferase involved in cell wall biosynthesis